MLCGELAVWSRRRYGQHAETVPLMSDKGRVRTRPRVPLLAQGESWMAQVITHSLVAMSARLSCQSAAALAAIGTRHASLSGLGSGFSLTLGRSGFSLWFCM